jgi:hypothetical protein
MAVKRATLSDHVKMAEAFLWAMNNGADIINCSFGYDGPWVLPDIVRVAMDKCASDGRRQKGCVIVWAAGNGNELISNDEWASYDKVLAVAASTDQDTRAYYSDFGQEVDVCAPSSGGQNGITTTAIGGYTSNFGGTSSAAPLVAGIAGLILSLNPNLTYLEVYDIICKSAEKIDVQNGKYNADGHSDWYGYGRVNAFRALDSIPVLEEAVRGTDLESRIDDIRLFANSYLQGIPEARQILEFLKNAKFDILRLLCDSNHAQFRKDIVTILRTTVTVYDAIRDGKDIVISDETWNAIGNVAQLIIKKPAIANETI